MGTLSAAPARDRVSVAPVATLVVYLWGFVIAGFLAVPMSASNRFERLVTADGFAWLEASSGGRELIGLMLSLVLLGTLLVWVAGPFLQGLWLHSLAHRSTLADAAAASIRLYPRMLVVTLLLTVPLLMAIGAALTLPAIVSVALDGVASERAEDVVAIASALPGVFLCFFWRAWHDTARASVALGLGPLRAARVGLAILGPRLFLAYAGWSLLAALLVAGAYGLGALAAGGASGLGVLVLTQILALGRTLTRERWLAAAIRAAR